MQVVATGILRRGQVATPEAIAVTRGPVSPGSLVLFSPPSSSARFSSRAPDWLRMGLSVYNVLAGDGMGRGFSVAQKA
jgi:hypothetical protein